MPLRRPVALSNDTESGVGVQWLHNDNDNIKHNNEDDLVDVNMAFLPIHIIMFPSWWDNFWRELHFGVFNSLLFGMFYDFLGEFLRHCIFCSIKPWQFLICIHSFYLKPICLEKINHRKGENIRSYTLIEIISHPRLWLFQRMKPSIIIGPPPACLLLCGRSPGQVVQDEPVAARQTTVARTGCSPGPARRLSTYTHKHSHTHHTAHAMFFFSFQEEGGWGSNVKRVSRH